MKYNKDQEVNHTIQLTWSGSETYYSGDIIAEKISGIVIGNSA